MRDVSEFNIFISEFVILTLAKIEESVYKMLMTTVKNNYFICAFLSKIIKVINSFKSILWRKTTLAQVQKRLIWNIWRKDMRGRIGQVNEDVLERRLEAE